MRHVSVHFLRLCLRNLMASLALSCLVADALYCGECYLVADTEGSRRARLKRRKNRFVVSLRDLRRRLGGA